MIIDVQIAICVNTYLKVVFIFDQDHFFERVPISAQVGKRIESYSSTAAVVPFYRPTSAAANSGPLLGHQVKVPSRSAESSSCQLASFTLSQKMNKGRRPDFSAEGPPYGPLGSTNRARNAVCVLSAIFARLPWP